MNAPRLAALLLAHVCVAGGCRQALTTLVDLPPPRSGTTAAAPADATSAVGRVAPADTVRPSIERVFAPDSVRALLPRDHAGNLDWMAALRAGLIRPRPVLPGRPAPAEPGFQFAFDFTYPGPDTTFDAFFPHSAHTEWVACQQCHPRIFNYRNTTVKMGDIFQGKYCGECHGKVAFPVLTGCERCHRSLAMPPNRAQGELVGTLTMSRPADASGAAAGLRTAELPAAVFPHWVHRIRFRCRACHMELFEPRNGANRVTMQQIADGAACGRCHNGSAAFAATIGTCQRCHVRPDSAHAGAGS